MNTLFLGHHINTSHGFVSSADYAESIGANFFQIFLSNPKSYKVSRRSKKDLSTLKHKLNHKNMKIVIHASYMLNFCNPPNSYKHTAAIRLLINNLKDSAILGSACLGVVIHMGKRLQLDPTIAFNNFVIGIRSTLSKSPSSSTIIFETGAGQGSEICTSLRELRRLYDQFSHDEQNRIKFCIDTCHVFAAGCNLHNTTSVNSFINDVTNILEWNNIACIHFNDSKTPCHSKKDRHADIGKGCIGTDGLKLFFLSCYQHNIPIVLETPCDTYDDCQFSRQQQIALIKSWL